MANTPMKSPVSRRNVLTAGALRKSDVIPVVEAEQHAKLAAAHKLAFWAL